MAIGFRSLRMQATIVAGLLVLLICYRLWPRMVGPRPLPPPELSGVDLLTATAGHLRELLDSGETTSAELVRLYLDQIAKHNHDGLKLHAINAVAPLDALLEQARALDAERKKSGPRSPLHGIPITLKVCTMTLFLLTWRLTSLTQDFYLAPSFGLGATCGSFALKGLTASEDAAIATALRDVGCIVIALANLSVRRALPMFYATPCSEKRVD